MGAQTSMTGAIEQLGNRLVHFGIVTESQFAAAKQSLTDSKTAEAAIDNLLADGSLTSYQAEHIREGSVGDLVVGNYVILNEIGAGAMGVVFKALHRRMDRVVAMKVIKAEVGASRQFCERFEHEVRAAARLNHPNVIAAYDAGESESGPYLVMQYVEGSDLHEIVRRGGPLKVHEALDYVRQAARGLDYAHEQGVVHRDIKPANLMRDVHGVIRIADLGLARLVPREGSVLEPQASSSQGKISGSVAYISPEQSIDSDAVDHRTDIYSLGCTLFFLLTGRNVFDEPTLIHTLNAHRHKPAPSLCSLRDDVPPAIDELFQRMVAKNPDDRCASMKEILDQLQTRLGESSTTDGAIWNPNESTVMIVDSSPTVQKIVRGILAKLGSDDLHLRDTGSAVLQSLATLPADVIVASMELPDMTGVELAQRIRNDCRWSKVAIVLMTASMSEAHQTAIRRLAGVGLLKKPFKETELQDSIIEAMQSNLISDSPIANLADVKVLIIDDSSVARRHVQRTLADIGFAQFDDADDGQTAVEVMQRQSFDLVVVDYNMPRMNGFEFVSHVRNVQGDKELPIVMCTTEFDPVKIAELYELGVSAVCNKSFDPELVRNIVVQLFH